MPHKIGLALGGGGAKGWAHIGAIRALEDADIPIHYVAGTSIGAVVGALYTSGELDALEHFVNHLDWKMIVSCLDVVFPRQGLLDGGRIDDLLSAHLERQIEETQIPFCCVSTNLMPREPVCISSGSLVEAVRASLSLPGIFTPVQREGACLVDGGLVNPLPIDVAREMGAEIVIAIDLNSSLSAIEDCNQASETEEDSNSEPGYPYCPDEDTGILESLEQRYRDITDTVQEKIDQWMPVSDITFNIFDIIGNSIDIMQQGLTRSNMESHPPDILIEVNLKDIGVFDFHLASRAIEAGYTQTKRQLDDIRQVL